MKYLVSALEEELKDHDYYDTLRNEGHSIFGARRRAFTIGTSKRDHRIYFFADENEIDNLMQHLIRGGNPDISLKVQRLDREAFPEDLAARYQDVLHLMTSPVS